MQGLLRVFLFRLSLARRLGENGLDENREAVGIDEFLEFLGIRHRDLVLRKRADKVLD